MPSRAPAAAGRLGNPPFDDLQEPGGRIVKLEPATLEHLLRIDDEVTVVRELGRDRSEALDPRHGEERFAEILCRCRPNGPSDGCRWQGTLPVASPVTRQL